MNKESPTIDPIIYSIGSNFGRYQLMLYLLSFYSKLPTGYAQISHVFLASPINVKCKNPPSADACSGNCKEYDFDRSIFEENIITQWGLVCEKKALANMTQTLLMLGILVGGFAFGTLGDLYGRRWTFVGSCLLNLVCSCLVPLLPYFWVYCILRFLDGAAVGGMMVLGMVIVMETLGKNYREILSLLVHIPFFIGHATLPVFAYYLRHWRWMHFGFATVSFVFIIYIWLIPESPRWLVVKGRLEEAVSTLEKMARINGKDNEHIVTIRPTIVAYQAEIQKNSTTSTERKYTVADLFKSRTLSIKTLAMAFNWFSTCLVYIGVSQYTTHLSGDIFLNVAISGVSGIPGNLTCIPMTRYLGRKITLISSTLLSAIGLLLIACTPDSVDIYFATLALFGASITFPNLYLYCAEIFPTVVRNNGLGLCSCIGRIGSMSAPFIASLADYYSWIPATIFGCTSLISAILALLFLHETKGTVLPETLDDAEAGKETAEQNQDSTSKK